MSSAFVVRGTSPYLTKILRLPLVYLNLIVCSQEANASTLVHLKNILLTRFLLYVSCYTRYVQYTKYSALPSQGIGEHSGGTCRAASSLASSPFSTFTACRRQAMITGRPS